MGVVLTIDAGTTGVRSMAVDQAGRIVAGHYREFPQYFPRPGWVEHDAEEIWAAVAATLAAVLEEVGEPVAAIGVTDQRETTVVWDRRTGRPLHRAVVWQDRRTAEDCRRLNDEGHLPLVRARTGLVLDPYFSATKLAWIIGPGGVPVTPATAFGTIDSWIIWKLSGGAAHVTDTTNASRTLLFDIDGLTWDADLAELFGVPLSILPEVGPSSGRLAATAAGAVPGLAAGVPVSGVAGDQQAALFGQACFEPGMTKNTYGTGSFVLMNIGSVAPPPPEGLLVTLACGPGGTPVYAMEGSIFVTGAAIQWLRDGLGIISQASETGPLAESVPDTGGVYFVPALTGLGSPYWDPYARGAIVGITRGTTRAHLARAAVEAIAYQTRDVVEAMAREADVHPAELRVDGGASVMDLLCQFQADQLGVLVRRPKVQETTALGAAFLAGLAEGVWSSTEELSETWLLDKEFAPSSPDPKLCEGRTRAVQRARGWARD